jgi:methionyl-tRNA formyltransferase
MPINIKSNIKFVFFGTSEFSVGILETLKHNGLLPTLIVATSDEAKGRGMNVQPVPTKVWAEIHDISVFQPENLRTPEVFDILSEEKADVFIVASYGKIIPTNIFELPKHKTLNVHPSLLPKLRGAAPLQYTILESVTAGVTIMRINEKMDEGAIVAQEELNIPEWPPHYKTLEAVLAKHGGEMLANILPDWLEGKIEVKEQDPSSATYTKKIEKKDADITNDTPEVALRKIRAYEVWPRARKGDLIVTDAHIENSELIIDRIIPPGKKEMEYKDYLRGHKN